MTYTHTTARPIIRFNYCLSPNCFNIKTVFPGIKITLSRDRHVFMMEFLNQQEVIHILRRTPRSIQVLPLQVQHCAIVHHVLMMTDNTPHHYYNRSVATGLKSYNSNYTVRQFNNVCYRHINIVKQHYIMLTMTGIISYRDVIRSRIKVVLINDINEIEFKAIVSYLAWSFVQNACYV